MKQKQTKIVATISDRKCDLDFLTGLVERGVDVFRLNTAHQTPDVTKGVIDLIRQVSSSVGILIDTKGPEIRTAGLEKELTAEEGELITLGNRDDSGADMQVSYGAFTEEVPEGAEILIDDGDVALKAEKRIDGRLSCRTMNSGIIKNRKSVNVPGVHINLPSLTEKDREYIVFAAENDIDFLAHSFVRSAADVEEIRTILKEYPHKPRIIAKIENREGVDNAEEILDAAHGIMVARGDLGIEIPAEEVPVIQKRLIRACIERAKPVITATQMLHSMIENPRATRAEISDIANAVLDGTDAVMLSGETAYGDYPFEAVEAMASATRAAEAYRRFPKRHNLIGCPEMVRNFLAKTAIDAAMELPIKALVVHTYSGKTARVATSYRATIPIFVKCHDPRVVRELSLSYGLHPSLIELPDSTDKLVFSALNSLMKEGALTEEDLVLVLAGSPPLNSNTSNLIEINTVARCIAERQG